MTCALPASRIAHSLDAGHSKREGLGLVVLAGLMWVVCWLSCRGLEGAERLSLPYDGRESGKGANLRGKVKAVFFSEVVATMLMPRRNARLVGKCVFAILAAYHSAILLETRSTTYL